MSQTETPTKQRLKGYLLGMIAAATYGTNPVFAVPLYGDGMNADSVLLFRYLFAIPMIGAMVLARGRRLTIPRGALMPALILGLLMAVSSLTLFLSYQYMNSGIASTLLFIYPVLVAVIMALFFREKVSAILVICIIVVSVGIGLLYKAPDGSTLSLTGTLLVGISALTYAIYLVAISHRRLKQVATLPLTFYVLLFGALLFVGRVIWCDSLTMPTHWYGWLNLLGLGLLPTAVSFMCTTRAIQLVGSTPTAILGALEPVAAILLGIIFLHQGLTPRETLGLALIIAAVTVVVAGARVEKVLVRVRRMFPAMNRSNCRPKKQ